MNNIGKGEELESWLNLFLILLYACMLFTIKYVQFKQYTGNFWKIKTKCNQKQIKYWTFSCIAFQIFVIQRSKGYDNRQNLSKTFSQIQSQIKEVLYKIFLWNSVISSQVYWPFQLLEIKYINLWCLIMKNIKFNSSVGVPFKKAYHQHLLSCILCPTRVSSKFSLIYSSS